MKRLLTSFLALAAAAVVFGQGAPFTIVRPADGSKVREKVHILFPKESVGDSGYIGIFLGGKFFEAVRPPTKGQYLDYTLDTKKVVGPDGPIADGPLHIEAVLYEPFTDAPKIVDRSSITVTVGNHENIDMPEKGFRFQYHFVPGTRWIYDITEAVSSEELTESQARNGAQGNMVSSDEKARLMYSIDNAYSDGSGLIRMQLLPPKGEDSALLTTVGSANPKQYFLREMKSVFMKVNNHGVEKFGWNPAFIGTWTGGSGITNFVEAVVPLPTLPAAPQKPGDPWSSTFQFPIANPSSDMIHVVRGDIPNRGEFQDVEWEMNHPCAKIHNEFELTDESHAKVAEDVWFALDKQIVIKAIQTLSIETKVVQQGGGGSQQNNNGQQVAQNAAPAPGTMGMRRGSTGAPNQNQNAGSADQFGRAGGPRGGGRGPGPSGGPAGQGQGRPPTFGAGGAPSGQANGNGRFTGGASGPAVKIVRQTFTRTMTFEG